HAGRRRLRSRTLGRDERREAGRDLDTEATTAAVSPTGSVPEGAGPLVLAPVGDGAAGESAGRRADVVVAERDHRRPHGDVLPLARRWRRHPDDDGPPCDERAGTGGAGVDPPEAGAWVGGNDSGKVSTTVIDSGAHGWDNYQHGR